MSFSGVRVLEDVQFDLAEGEVHALAGENGAGKTTLMRILSGVYDAYEGQVLLDGAEARFRSPRQAAERGVGMIHQELSLVPGMNAVDNIHLGREWTRTAGWIDYRAAARHVRDLLARLGVEVDLRRPVEDFPMSVRQMIEIAKALAYEAKIIIMDEPTSALNRLEADRLFEVIGELRKQGRSVVYITHKMEEIYRIADRITVLRDGRYVSTAAAADLSRDDLVRRMVGRDVDQFFPRRGNAGGREMLRVKGLGVPDPTGRRAWAVEGLSFSVRGGEVLGLAGLEGSGNHEALRAIFEGSGRGGAGSVIVDGRERQRRSPVRSIRAGVAYLTNDRKGNGLVLNMSIVENTTLAAIPRYSPGGWMRRAAEADAARRRVETLRTRCASVEQPVAELSGGNQQKVAMAKWLETEPGVLLLDEPTRGVDVGAKKDLYDLIAEWTKSGMAVVLITSEMPELLALCDRIIVLHRGRAAAEYARGEATQERILAAAMGGTAA